MKKEKEKRLSLEEVASLLKNKQQLSDDLLAQAYYTNLENYKKEISLYGVSYVSDYCVNDCSYCGHSSRVCQQRLRLTPKELAMDLSAVLESRPNELCLLAGQDPAVTAQYLLEAINLARDIHPGLERVSLNVAPMTSAEYRLIKKNTSGILQYRIFQESYLPDIYRRHHKKGPKRNHILRRVAQSTALFSGFDEVGIGVLLGLNPICHPYAHAGNDVEIHSLIAHAYELEDKHGKPPYSVSLPRLQPVSGSCEQVPYAVDDDTYMLYHAIVRIALPDTRIIMTRRESKEFIDRVRPLINIEDLATRPGVGGNYRPETHLQNMLGDTRSSENIIFDLVKQGYKVRLRV